MELVASPALLPHGNCARMQLAVAQAEVTLGNVEANLATARKLLEQA